ncbi:nicotinate-nucleotide--dimethylbenzimidazole phosphoribosyltransferase [Corynebacterium sp. 21KM1197]|uniref:nicotinate-nucleotide--dimethylbenzimidazole phosphoribosyltransferase n=1 Tax=Corynebacterium sp. 21KM1197 TaxID=2989734 RepID=UPI0029CA715E|nr:nicotinate-nucleotide--dimethylbenzimidazole phosphoribosyltransferase [Corynebacterium sp. 21KM1197]WPF67972.1 nicotinate-nucleotide--dimethylbenzimidazole phosphoribosyltransferase [Corynebacterium sp. 21KM1197]
MNLFNTVAPPTGGAEHLPTPIPVEAAGRLRDVAAFFASVQGVTADAPLRPIVEPRLVLVSGGRAEADTAGTTEITDDAASTATGPRDVAAQLLEQFHAGTGPTLAFAEATGIATELVESPSPSSFEEALSLGIRTADAHADRGVDLVLPASLGHGDEEEALALLGLLCSEEPVAVVGFHGTSDKRWSQRVSRVRDLMFSARDHRGSAADILRHLANPAMITLVGFLAQSASRRTPILLDTTVTCVAACYAQALAPGARDWMLAGQLTPQAGHLLAVRHLGLTPLFALNMPLGMGTGAASAMPLIRAATTLYAR